MCPWPSSSVLLKRLAGLAGLLAFAASAHAKQPNIIVIFMEDLGYNDIGPNTYPSRDNPYPAAGPEPKPLQESPALPMPNEARDLTPAIDRLAKEGIQMTSFYATAICSPS